MPLPLAVPLASMGVGLLGGLFNKSSKVPSLQELMSQFGPGALAQNTTQLYDFLKSSPQFMDVLNKNAAAGANLSQSLNQNLGARGLTTTGVGSVASSLGANASAFGASALRGGLFGEAGSMAQNNLSQMLQAYLSTLGMKQNQPNRLDSLFSSLLTAGASALPFAGGEQGFKYPKGGTGIFAP